MKKKGYVIFLCSLAVILTITHYSRSIFPSMRTDEYFVDKYDVIHNKSCPYKSVPWFAVKHSKYNFLRETQQEFCNECFLKEEIETLMTLHEINLNNEALRLERVGSSDDYIGEKLKKYGY